jgi:ATP-binding cassette subfamily B protein
VWQTSRTVTIALAAGSVLAGAAPTAMAWTGKRLIDAVVHASGSGDAADKRAALFWVGAELALAVVLLAANRHLLCGRSCARSCAPSSATASTS